MMRPRRAARIAGPVVAFLVFLTFVAAHAPSPLIAGPGEPDLPPGLDPGGIAVALVGPGIDYTRPQLAARLARDGEGEPIGFDFLDGDLRPYEAASVDATRSDGPTGTELAESIIARAPMARLVVYRAQLNDARVLPAIAHHASLTPARILAIPYRLAAPGLRASLHASAQAHDTLLIVAIATAPTAASHIDPRQSDEPAPPNIIAVSPDGTQAPGRVVARAAALAARILHASPGLELHELRTAVLRRLARLPQKGYTPLHLNTRREPLISLMRATRRRTPEPNDTTRGSDAHVRTDS